MLENIFCTRIYKVKSLVKSFLMWRDIENKIQPTISFLLVTYWKNPRGRNSRFTRGNLMERLDAFIKEGYVESCSGFNVLFNVANNINRLSRTQPFCFLPVNFKQQNLVKPFFGHTYAWNCMPLKEVGWLLENSENALADIIVDIVSTITSEHCFNMS